MISKLSGWEDTIIATATPPGIGAIGVIRISGTRAYEIVEQIFPSKSLRSLSSHTIHFGLLTDNGEAIDEVLLSLFKGPRSYTGEDTIEISCHGSPHVQQRIIRACTDRGARLARAGEFTQRAFLGGKLDLTQAEAVADLIAADTDAAQRTALNNIRGGFSSRLKEMRDQLIQFSALLELELDFATEDVAFADRGKFQSLVKEIGATTDELLNSFQLGNVIKNGVSVAIIGKPNAGKSTLLNTLLNEERSIVSDIAGTTRDTIEEILNISGVLFRLIDTAGIRSHSTDVIENIGMERSLKKMASADTVLYIFDVHTETTNDLQEQVKLFEDKGVKYLLVANKSEDDLVPPAKYAGFNNVYFISAKENCGVNELKTALFEQTVQALPKSEDVIITNARHYDALQQVRRSLDEISLGLMNELPGDLLALDTRRCLFFLGEITGEVTNEDKLDYIFSKFCIGK